MAPVAGAWLGRGVGANLSPRKDAGGSQVSGLNSTPLLIEANELPPSLQVCVEPGAVSLGVPAP